MFDDTNNVPIEGKRSGQLTRRLRGRVTLTDDATLVGKRETFDPVGPWRPSKP